MPSTKTWIHSLTKEQLIKLAQRHQIDTTGSIDDLRKRLKIHAEQSLSDMTDRAGSSETTDSIGLTDKDAQKRSKLSAKVKSPDDDPTLPMDKEGSRTSPPCHGETMNLVRKWGVRFTGKDPLAFLERVEELREGYGLSHEQMLRCLPELISGEPLLWYRNNREGQLGTTLSRTSDYAIARIGHKPH